jgi:superfamily II DNA/RNA helicase
VLQDQKKGLSALILVPTKELCDQTHKHVKALAQYCSKLVSIVAVSSTVDVESQKYVVALSRNARRIMQKDSPV